MWNRVGSCSGKHPGIQLQWWPFEKPQDIQFWTIPQEDGGGVVGDWGSSPGVPFPPSTPSPPNAQTHTSESPLPTLGQAPKEPAGRKQQRKSLILKLVAQCRQDTIYFITGNSSSVLLAPLSSDGCYLFRWELEVINGNKMDSLSMVLSNHVVLLVGVGIKKKTHKILSRPSLKELHGLQS